MREYGQIQSSFWGHPDIATLSDQAKLLATYLLTGPHTNGIGCFRLPDGYVAADLGWPFERLSEAFEELFRIGFCKRCERTNYVLMPTFLKWNALSNTNVAKARAKEFMEVPKQFSFIGDLARAIVEFGANFEADFLAYLEGLRNPSETIPKQVRTPDPNPDPYPEPTQPERVDGTLTRSVAGQELVTTGSREVRTATAERKTAKTAAIWDGYASAYLRRYNTEPVRNAKVNALLAQVVDRLGANEAPHVAAWYVGSNRALYVSSKHCAELLSRDCEGLRTEWATRTRMTDTEARQADQHQAAYEAAEWVDANIESLRMAAGGNPNGH
jgi:hypothetical protein